MHKFSIGLVIGLVVGVVLAVAGPQTNNLDSDNGVTRTNDLGTVFSPIEWRLSGPYAGDMKFMAASAHKLSKRITGLTRSGIKVFFDDSGTPINDLDLFEAVSSGTIKAAYSTPVYWRNKSRGFDLLGGVPFGPTGSEFLTWYYSGDGKSLADRLFRRHNVQALLCGLSGPIAGDLFIKPISSLKDLHNKKIAAVGLGALVLKRAGAIIANKTPKEVVLDLRNNNLFGSTFATPLNIGSHILEGSKKYLYFPGWSQQFSSYYLMIHLRDWHRLSKIAQMRVHAACAENILDSLSSSEGTQFNHLKLMINHGAEIHHWPAEVIDNLRTIWKKETKRLSKNDRDFRRLWNSLKSFQRDHKIWKELGYL